MKLLVVIESSTKVLAFKKAFSSCGYKPEIFATQGTLFDLPNHETSFDACVKKSNGEPLSAGDLFKARQVVNPAIYSALKSKAEKSDHVCCFTDNDLEGELIALDVKALCGKLGKKFTRHIAGAIATREIERGFKRPKKLRQNVIKEALLRRFVNRLSGYGQSTAVGYTGYSLSPTLKAVKDKQINRYFFQRVIHVNNSSSLIVRGLSKKPVMLSDSELTAKTLKQSHREPHVKGVCFQSLVALLAGTSKEPLQKNISDLQECYKKGAISYFRTEADFYLKESRAEHEDCATRAFRHPKCFDTFLLHLDDADACAHESIHLVENPGSLTIEQTKLVETIAKEYLLRLNSLSQYSFALEGGGVADGFLVPSGSRLSRGGFSDTVTVLDKESAIGLAQLKQGLSTPSTFLSSALKASRYANDDCELTSAGESMLKHAEHNASWVVDPGVRQKISAILCEPPNAKASLLDALTEGMNKIKSTIVDRKAKRAPSIDPELRKVG